MYEAEAANALSIIKYIKAVTMGYLSTCKICELPQNQYYPDYQTSALKIKTTGAVGYSVSQQFKIGPSSATEFCHQCHVNSCLIVSFPLHKRLQKKVKPMDISGKVRNRG